MQLERTADVLASPGGILPSHELNELKYFGGHLGSAASGLSGEKRSAQSGPLAVPPLGLNHAHTHSNKPTDKKAGKMPITFCTSAEEGIVLRKLWSGCGLEIHPQVSRFFESGSSLILLPVATKMAFESAGAMTDTPGSPTPAGGALLSTT